MTHDERSLMILRFGVMSGLAGRLLRDDSYAARWIGKAHELTETEYVEQTAEIQSRLVAAGVIGPDEDAYESYITGKL